MLFACEYCYGAEFLLAMASVLGPAFVLWLRCKLRRKCKTRHLEK